MKSPTQFHQRPPNLCYCYVGLDLEIDRVHPAAHRQQQEPCRCFLKAAVALKVMRLFILHCSRHDLLPKFSYKHGHYCHNTNAPKTRSCLLVYSYVWLGEMSTLEPAMPVSLEKPHPCLTHSLSPCHYASVLSPLLEHNKAIYHICSNVMCIVFPKMGVKISSLCYSRILCRNTGTLHHVYSHISWCVV